MKNKYSEELRHLIAADLLSEAFDVLKHWTDDLKITDYQDQYSILLGRYNALISEIRGGSLSQDQATIYHNQIRKDILEFCRTLEKAGPPPSINKREKGVLAHNIPGAMKKGLIHECKVRIAKEELILLENFDPAAPVAALSISDEMEVELIDVQGDAFEIKTHNRKTQTILDGEATEWIFYVKPLLTGNHTLSLKAAIIIIGPDNQKIAKEYTYTNIISVETTTETSDKPITNNNWQVLSAVFSIFTKKKKNRMLPAWLPPGVAKAAAIVAALTTISILSYLGYQKYRGNTTSEIPEVPQEEQFLDLSLKIDTTIEVQFIKITQDTIWDWVRKEGSDVIVIPQLTPRPYYIHLEGEKGTCKGRINLSTDSTFFELPCIPKITTDSNTSTTQTNDPKPPQESQNYAVVKLITPFANPLIKVNNVEQPLISSREFSAISYESTIHLPPGNLVLQAIDRTNNFQCDKKALIINGFQQVVFDCTTTLRIILTGQNVEYQADQTRVILNNIEKPDQGELYNGVLTFDLRVKRGSYLVKIINPHASPSNCINRVLVNSAKQVEYNCNFEYGY